MDLPKSDLARSTQHEPDFSWPAEVKVQLIWLVDGRPVVRSEHISGDAFFGLGNHGAPMDGSALVGMIERLRRAGPPIDVPRVDTGRPPNSRKPWRGGLAKKGKQNGKAR